MTKLPPLDNPNRQSHPDRTHSHQAFTIGQQLFQTRKHRALAIKGSTADWWRDWAR